jgi:hypothetical protein
VRASAPLHALLLASNGGTMMSLDGAANAALTTDLLLPQILPTGPTAGGAQESALLSVALPGRRIR